MAKEQKPKQQLNIELPEDVAEGVYSNLAMVAHSNSEFIIDFMRLLPNVSKARVKSRVLLSPQHAKQLLRILNDNINKFERQHGPIKENGQQNGGIPPIGFTPTAQA